MIVSLSLAGQAMPVQRATASPSGRSTSDPQTGQRIGQPEFFLFARTFFGNYLDDLGNHISSPLNHHGIPDTNIFSVDFILVVQSGAADRYPSDMDRLQDRRRGQSPGPSHVDDDVENLGGHLLGLELESQSPPGAAGDRSQVLLEAEGVDFDDHPINLIGELLPELIHFPVVFQDLFDILAAPPVGD